NASRPDCGYRRPVLRSFDPSRRGYVGVVASQTFVGEKEEKLVFPDRPAQAGTELTKIIVHANRRSVIRTSVLIKSVPVWILIFEESRSMQLVRAALGHYLNLSARVSAVFR